MAGTAKYVVLGLLLGLLVAFPPLAVQLGHLALAAAVWAAGQPAVWAFALGLLARPRIARRLTGGTR